MTRTLVRLRAALALVVLGLLASTPDVARPDDRLEDLDAVQNLEGLEDLDALVERGRAAWNVPGVAVGIVTPRETITRGYGVRRLGHEDPITPRTLFAVASNTKAFTAALLGQLVDEKKLRWDDRVLEHLPAFRLHDSFATNEMTVLDLLTHRSGLPTFGGDHLWIGSELTKDEILSRLRFLQPTASFRLRYQYQNLMYLVAGELAATIDGADWTTLMRRRLLEPLGMADSLLSIDALHDRKDVASAHELRNGQLAVVPYDDVDSVAPAAALISNVTDMCRWMRLHLGGGELDGKRLLETDTVRELHTMQIALPVSAWVEERFGRRFSGYALGWGISDHAGRKVVAHGGALTGMISRQALVPEEGIGVVILTNHADNSLAAALSFAILDRLLDAPRRDWIGDMQRWEEERAARANDERRALEAARHRDTQPSLALEKYEGVYTNRLSGGARIELREGQLWFVYNPRHTGPLEHWHHDTFRVRWSDPIFDMPPESFVEFDLNRDGDVSQLTIGFYHPNVFEREAKPSWRGF